jgi:hypothetical protein
MNRLAGRDAFKIGSEVYTWDDVLTVAHLDGDYRRLVGTAKRGVASEAQLAKRGSGTPEDDVDEAAEAWRYDRDLLAADDLEEWLDQRRLTYDEWLGYVTRGVASHLAAGTRGVRVSAQDVEAVLYAEAVCSGLLTTLAERLAGRAAAYASLQSATKTASLTRCPKPEVGRALARLPEAIPVPRARAGHLACLEIVFRRFLARASTSAAVAREVESHRLEWTRLVCETVYFPSDEAAREAYLLVRSDGLSLRQAASTAGTRMTRTTTLLDDAPDELRVRLVGAQPGDVVAPVPADDGFLVVSISSRTEPSTADADIRRRAADRLVDRAVRAEVEKRVRWVERI